METEKLQNWNQLEYAKYSFWQDSIYIDKKEISIFVYLEIQYKDSENPHIIIKTDEIDIESSANKILSYLIEGKYI